MVGLSHVAFRELVKSYTPQHVNAIRYTEMLSTRRIPNEKLETTNELRTALNETYFIPQLLGNEEKYIAPSIEKLMTKGPVGFDINMGCPVSHSLKHNWGVKLMGDKDYAASVVKIAKKHSPIPISVKLRITGSGESDVNELLDFCGALQDAGAHYLTIHGRTRSQKHSGEANWGLVAKVRNALSIPVVANGNIQTSSDAISVIKEFGCDGSMIARATCARPWILWQIAEDLGINETPIGYEGKRAPRTPEEEGKEYVQACLKLISFLKFYFKDDSYVLERFRFFAATGARWFEFGHFFWKTSMRVKTVEELELAVEEFSEKYENKMYAHINII